MGSSSAGGETLAEAHRALLRGEPDTAIDLAGQIHARRPGDAAASRLIGLAYSLKGAAFAELGIRFLEQAKASGADSVDIHVALARSRLHREQFTEARRSLDDAARIAHADHLAIIDFHRGLCFVGERDWARAVPLFDSLRESAKYGKLATGWLGVIAARQGDDIKAMELFERLPPAGATPHEENHRIFLRHYRDILANRRPHAHAKRILTLRHPVRSPNFYKVFLDWVAKNHPRYESLFELRLLPCPPLDTDNYALLLPWLQDPVEDWSTLAYAQACELEARFARHGIKTVNPVSRLSHAGKFEGSRRMAAAGLRTPKMVRVADIDAFKRDRGGLAFPFFIREDWGHGGTFERIENDAQLARVDVAALRRPVAVEIVDARSSDGLYRKYRHYAIGNYGISYNQLVCEHWITRSRAQSIDTPATRAEALAYIARPDPHQALFQKAREALALDYVAFDYGFDRSGQVVIWEANPYPFVEWPGAGHIDEFRIGGIHRLMATRLLFYLEQAGIEPPRELRLVAAYDPAGEAALAAFAPP